MPEDHVEALTLGLSELTAILLSTPTVEDSLQQMATIASRMLPDHPAAGITLRRGADTTTVVSEGPRSMQIDNIQYDEGNGPCLEAITTAAPVSVPDTTIEQRWGDYPVRIVAAGVGSVYSEPLLAEGVAIGALNLYSPHHNGFDASARYAIALTGRHASMVLTAVTTAVHAAALTTQLREALASRSVIDQALGMLMGQRRCGRAAAFAVMRKASQDRNIKIGDLAAEIVILFTGTVPEPGDFLDPGQSPR